MKNKVVVVALISPSGYYCTCRLVPHRSPVSIHLSFHLFLRNHGSHQIWLISTYSGGLMDPKPSCEAEGIRQSLYFSLLLRCRSTRQTENRAKKEERKAKEHNGASYTPVVSYRHSCFSRGLCLLGQKCKMHDDLSHQLLTNVLKHKKSQLQGGGG